jgi:hypothetical protein
MKKMTGFLLALLLLLCSLPIFAYTNFLPNPSFEQEGGDWGPAGGWKQWANSGSLSDAVWTWEEGSRHTGSRSVSIKNIASTAQDVAVISPVLGATAGNCYTFSAWVKSENMQSGSVFVMASFFDGGGWKSTKGFPTTLPVGGSWVQLAGTFQIPQGMTGVQVGVRILPPVNPEAKLFIDDLALYQVSATSFMLEQPEGMAMIPSEEASGGYLAYRPPTDPQYAYLNYQFPTLPAGTYKYKIRYRGDPINSGAQRIYIGGKDQPEIWFPTKTDAVFFSTERTFTSDGTVNSILIKKWSALGTGTNPIDWIWIGPEGAIAPEGQVSILEPPGNLTSEYIGPHEVSLSWQPPASESGIGIYQVYRGLTPDFAIGEATHVIDTTETAFSELMDPAHPVYYYKIVAWNSIYGGKRSPSAQTSVRSDNVPPGKPSDLSGSAATAGLVTLNWTPPQEAGDGERAAGYKVYRSEVAPQFGQTPLALIDEQTPGFTNDPLVTMQWKDKGVTTGTNYYYAVSAYDDDGNESALSVLSSPLQPTADTILPNPPHGAQIDPDTIRGGVIFTWTTPQAHDQDDDLAEKFIVYRSLAENPSQSWQQGGARFELPETAPQAGAARRFVDVTAIPGSSYYYALVSIDKAGNESEPVSWQEIVPLAPYTAELQAPKAGMAAVDGPPTFTWTQPQAYAEDQVESYSVQLARDENFVQNFLESNPTAETSYQHSATLAPGVWHWRVKVKYQSGVTCYSDTESFQSVLNGESGLKVAFFEVSPRIYNPRAGELLFNYVLAEDSYVTVKLFNIHGKLLKVLQEPLWQSARDGSGALGNHLLYWNGKTAQGQLAPRGIYLIQAEIKTPGVRPTKVTKRFQVVH